MNQQIEITAYVQGDHLMTGDSAEILREATIEDRKESLENPETGKFRTIVDVEDLPPMLVRLIREENS
jgi:hypothetical protein